jgi:hypothetical protein
MVSKLESSSILSYGEIQMSPAMKKALALMLVLVSAIGLLFSLLILIQVWWYRQPVKDIVESGLNQSYTILQTTSEGLDILDQVTSNVYTSTINLDEATKALTQTVQNTNLFIDSAGTFIGTDLFNTITNTQTALDSAQASAVVIDNVLSTLSLVPLIGITYNPSLPLNVALGEVSDSLDPLQKSLKTFQTNLETTHTNIQDFNDQITILEQNIIAINLNLAQAQKTIKSYQSQVRSIKSWVGEAKTSLPTWINSITWILTAIILWLMIVQSSLLLHGITLSAHDHSNMESVRKPQ